MKILLAGIMLISSFAISGQVPATITPPAVTDDPFIRWIARIPSGDSAESIGFFEKIFNFIVGGEQVVFNNPVNIYAKGTQNNLIVNQGEGSILQQVNGKTELVPAFKKGKRVFPSIVGICALRSDGHLFTDSRLNKIFLLSADGKQIIPLNTTDSLIRPTGIAYSEITDEVWVVETGSHRISVLNRKGERKKIIGKRGTGQGEFNFPTYIWIDSSGKIYIVDSMNYRVQIFSQEGNFITAFGQQGDATGCFARPRGVATDSQGNIYVVDALFDVVQIFDISGKLLYYFGAQGNGKYEFWMPSGIFIDRNDYIYVADSYNSRVEIFQLKKNNQR